MQHSEIVDRLFGQVRDWRRHLHRHPELSGQEKESAGFLCRVLDEHGVSHRGSIGGHGIVARIEPEKENRRAEIAFRADFDALPLQDSKECDWASVNPGVMHACGHDGHAAVLLGLAVALQRNRHLLPGPVKLIFQPAEENGAGALAMLKEGVFEPPPAAVFGFHFFPELLTGEIGLHRGPAMAATEYLEILVRGRSSHACAPQRGVDAIAVAAALIGALNQLVTKHLDPVDPALISIGTIQGGTVSNIIANEVRLTGTIRTLSREQHRRLHEALRRLIADFPAAFGAKAELSIGEVAPALVNDDRLMDFLAAFLRREFPNLVCRENDPPLLGGEDFARFAELCPGAYIFVGCGNPEMGITHPLHSVAFDLDEEALKVALRLFLTLALEAGSMTAFLNDSRGQC